VVRGERIAWVATDPPGRLASGITVVDGTGRYLVPGLIDGHVHLAALPGLSDRAREAMPSLVDAYYDQLPRSYLYFGFTAVVDVNVVDRAKVDRVRKADLGPAVLDCGNALVLANAYPMLNRPSPERFRRYPNFLYDPRQAGAIPPEYTAADHSPEAAVARVAAGGGVCIKSFYEPGDPAKPFPVPTLEMMRAVHEAGRRHGLPLLLHANSIAAHRFAVEAGVDAVVHGLWSWPGATGEGDLPDEARAVLDAERRQGIGYMPTLRVMSGLADMFAPGFLDDDHLRHAYPPALLAWYRSPEGRWYADELNPDRLSPERMRALAGIQRRRATMYMAAQGGRILFGSDTPSDDIYTNPPGYNGYLELREMEAAGVPPARILAAATLENARLVHVEDRYGTVEAGKVASLLLLREDPLASTAAFDTIETVLVRGRVVPRSALSASAN
jgi:imidazolonepropionase-like amidohydrolase